MIQLVKSLFKRRHLLLFCAGDKANAGQRIKWNRASAILAMIHNAHMAKGRPAKPSDFNPFKQESMMVIDRENAIKVFRQLAEGKPVTLPKANNDT